LTNFSSSINNGKTQNSYSRKNSFAQNARGGNVKNNHHQNHSDSFSSESLIKHTCDLTSAKIYDNYGDLEKVYRDVHIERLFYLLLPGAKNEDISVSAGLYIFLKDVVVWVRKDCGLRITEQDLRVTVARYMPDRLEIANDVIFACSKQYQENGEGRRDSHNNVENSLWKHRMSQNARTTHERPELAVNMIGSAVGVSVNTEVVSINSPWTINKWAYSWNSMYTVMEQDDGYKPGSSGQSGGYID